MENGNVPSLEESKQRIYQVTLCNRTFRLQTFTNNNGCWLGRGFKKTGDKLRRFFKLPVVSAEEVPPVVVVVEQTLPIDEVDLDDFDIIDYSVDSDGALS
jgi:hypothetical protein